MVTRSFSARSTNRRVGVSLGAAELCASFTSDGKPAIRRIPLEPFAADAPTWPSLARALTELRGAAGKTSVSISLLPLLAEVRTVELPPLRDDEAERALARSAGKYFVNARQAQIVGVAPRPKRAAPGAPRVAAAAPARLIGVILSAAREAGVSITSIGPAEGAWTGAAIATWPALARGRANVVVAHAASTDLLRTADGVLESVRRFRAGAADAALIAETIRGEVHADGSIRAAVLGTREQRGALARALAEQGLVVTTPAEQSTATASPEVLAAYFAGARGGPQFRTEDARATRRREAWRTTFVVAGAAAAVFVAGAAIELWGVHRQLVQARAERARLAPQLSATLVGRSSVETVYHHLSTLTEAQRGAPELSRTIADLSDALPDGSYLTALRTRGDSLVLDGLADQATDAFTALEKIPQLANVRSAAPVRRQVQSDSTPLERFTIAARMVHK